MFSSVLGGLGKSLLGGAMSGGGGGDLFGSIGNIVKGFAPMIQPLAGMAGTALGGYFGGPLGATLGGNLASSLGGSLSNIIGGGSSQSQPQMQQGQFGPAQSYGNMWGTSMGNSLNQQFNQHMPQQLQGQTFGNMGGALGDYFGQKFGMPELGRSIGNIANPYLQNLIPQSMRDVNMGNFGGYIGNQFGQQVDRGFQSRGLTPYAPNSYGGSQTGYGAPEPYGNIPEAPPLQLDNRGFPGGGNIPAAPPFNAPAPSMNMGYMPPVQPGRGALLEDIRNYRRPSNQPVYQGPSNIPAAPPLQGNFSSPSSGIRSGARISNGMSMLDEVRQRSSMPNMGLRPTQPAVNNAPVAPQNNWMDALRSGLASRRSAIEPEDRFYMSQGMPVRAY